MFKRPTWESTWTYVTVSLLLSLLFVAVYGPANAWAAQAPDAYRLWLPFELSLPLIPEFLWIYFSLNLLTFLPLFVLSASQIRRLAWCFAVAILVAGVFFVLLPARIGWLRPASVERYDAFFQTLYRWDQSANTFPSLHIAFSWICVRAMINETGWRIFLGSWFSLIALSVLLTHQHHVADIGGGMLLAEGILRGIYFRNSKKAAVPVSN